jgi:transposase
VVRTFAPVGETPVLHEQVTRDHLSAISGITLEGKLLVKTQDHSFHGTEAVSFLKHLVKVVSDRLLVVWDGSPIHGSNEVHQFLASEEGKGVWLERLPGYAPDLNPDEGIWNYLKGVELKNVVCQDMGGLFTEFREAVQRLRQKPRIIRACFAEVGIV